MVEAAKRKTKPAIDASLLDGAFDEAPQQAELAERQEIHNRAAVRAVREEADLAPGAIAWRRQATRLITLPHALDLAESIAVHGLIEPIVIDQRGVLLAGGHRLFAVLLLDTPPAQRPALLERLAAQIAPASPFERPGLDGRIQALVHKPTPTVRVNRLAIDGETDPSAALEVEIVENEKRRDYTRAEIRELARTLESHGWSFRRGARAADGKPVSGQRMLELITGKSASTLWRLLNADRRPATPTAAPARTARLTVADVVAWLGACDEEHVRTVLEVARMRLGRAAE